MLRAQAMSDRRWYLIAVTVTTLLTAAALVVFLSVRAFVGSDRLPRGGAGETAGSAPIAAPSAAPRSAARALGSAPRAVAAVPAGAALAAAPDGRPAPPAQAGPGSLAGPGAGSAPGGCAVAPCGPGRGTQGGPGGRSPGPAAPRAGAAPGALQALVAGVDNTAGHLGVDARLGPLTRPLTRPLDRDVAGTLDSAGGLVGSPRLGTGVERSAGRLSRRLLGPGGLTDQLLGG